MGGLSTERASSCQRSHFKNYTLSLWHLAGSLLHSSVARAIWNHTEMQRFLTGPTLFCNALGCSLYARLLSGYTPTRPPTS
ncbi:hypothetical protein M431DRAFT_503872 [Trichoderma harzianum CBS 226.95]|uniref:Uncharacterized protein n=1 Tax=Trichoderma harzianum CBS 226.95 TaxID=983964 RepID=A0A2T4APB5_TRIHA|nr:hypothetical protein M431DRAFT_503872 [Trichoderma harzianum CBS 226.95]PTB58911.1 hypothetical protein M431DRAFT_503872 [Trichoderma harzianum CBS 226.95]